MSSLFKEGLPKHCYRNSAHTPANDATSAARPLYGPDAAGARGARRGGSGARRSPPWKSKLS